MKSKNLKKLCFLLGLVVLGFGITGCKQQEANSESVANAEKVKIEYYHGLGGNLGENMQSIIDEFNKSSEKFEVVPVIQGNYTETLQALQASLAAGKPPALALNGYPEFMKLADSEVLVDLKDYVEESEYNKDDILESLLVQGEYQGKQLAIPAYASTQLMYYRKDIFEKHGINYDEIKNFEQLVEVTKEIKAKDNIFGWSIMWYTEHMIDYARSAGGDILSEDGKTVTIDSPEWIYAWDTVREAIYEDESMETIYGGNGWEYWYKTIDHVMNGMSAGYTGSSGDGGDLDFSIISAGMQKGFKDSNPRPVAVSVVLTMFENTSDEQKEGAWEFAKFYTNSQNSGKWAANTGYIPVRKSAIETDVFKAKLAENPSAAIPLKQAQTNGIPPFVDPTGGKIYTIIDMAKDRLLIENIPASTVLKEAQIEAQKELDKIS